MSRVELRPYSSLNSFVGSAVFGKVSVGADSLVCRRFSAFDLTFAHPRLKDSLLAAERLQMPQAFRRILHSGARG
jgi:hypothetical protein